MKTMGFTPESAQDRADAAEFVFGCVRVRMRIKTSIKEVVACALVPNSGGNRVDEIIRFDTVISCVISIVCTVSGIAALPFFRSLICQRQQ